MTNVDLKALGQEVGLNSSDITGDEKVIKVSEGWLAFLKQEFQAPCLQLVTHYLQTTNGYKRKSVESCLADFRGKYPKSFKIMAFFDLLFRLTYLSFFLIVAARGLGIQASIKSIIDYLGRVLGQW